MLLQHIAEELWLAEENYTPVEQISSRYGLNLDQAYRIQDLNVSRRLKNGAKLTGKKIGLTSAAMQKSLGVDTPDFGILYDTMEVKDGAVPSRTILQPRVEGELAFRLKSTLSGECSAEEVLAATDYVTPAIEIVGSRIKDWKLTLVDTVADNASCGMYLMSDEKFAPSAIDLTGVGLSLYKNSNLINQGFSVAVMGNPLNAVRWLAKCLGEYGVTLNAGDWILAGAITAAVPAEPGDEFLCDFDHLGKLAVRFL